MTATSTCLERPRGTHAKPIDINTVVTDVILSMANVIPENSRLNCRLSANRLSVLDHTGKLGSALYFLMMDLILASKRRKQKLDITISSRRDKQDNKKGRNMVVLEIQAHGGPVDAAEPAGRDWRFVNEAVHAEGGRLLVEFKPARKYLVELPEAE